MEDVYVLFGFLFSSDNLRPTLKSGKLHERCKNLEQTLHDIEADYLVLEINSAVHTFPDQMTC